MQTSSEEARQAIITVLASIPCGYVCTYGTVAKLAGQPGKARLVGYILKHLPESSNIPWHRVINSQGLSSFPVDTDKYLLQISKLRSEGIRTSTGRISLKEYLWLAG